MRYSLFMSTKDDFVSAYKKALQAIDSNWEVRRVKSIMGLQYLIKLKPHPDHVLNFSLGFFDFDLETLEYGVLKNVHSEFASYDIGLESKLSNQVEAASSKVGINKIIVVKDYRQPETQRWLSQCEYIDKKENSTYIKFLSN